MGVSTDAKLVYGVPVPDWDECSSFSEEFMETGVFEALFQWKDKANKEFYEEYPEYKDEYEPTGREGVSILDLAEMLSCDEFPVDVVSHCSSECPMWVIAVRGKVKVASRGEVVRIDPGEMESVTGFSQLLLDFCKKFEIPIGDSEPGWLLVSEWD